MVDQIPQAQPVQPAPMPGTPPQAPQQQPAQAPQQQPVQQSAPQQPIPQTIPGQPVQPNGRPQQSANITKPGSKISMKGIFIGCGLIFMFVIGGLALVFYNLINNPTQLATVGLDPNTTRNLLQAFSVVFFGLLTFLGIGLLIVNLYRVITVKNKPKIGYIFWAFFGFILFIVSIALWARVINIVKWISVDSMLDSDRLVMTYLQLKDGPKHVRNTANLYLIAPGNMFFMLNRDYYNARIIGSLGQVSTQAVVLDCGNGQTLNLNLSNLQFEGFCSYFKKGEYPLSVEVSYTNMLTSERLQQKFPGWSVVFESEIVITPVRSSLTFNDTKTEMILGKAPAKIEFDANAVFRDFSLSEYLVSWDFDGDGKADKQNVAIAGYIFNQAKVYNVYVRFPGLNDHIYTFPVRVEQSDVPICNISVEKGQENMYIIATNFLERNVQISDYKFDILERNNKDAIVETIRNKNGTFNYAFPKAGNYAVQVTFLTDEGKQWRCESEDIQIGVSDFQISYDMYFKSPQTPQFKKVTNQWVVYYENDGIIVTEVPTVLRLEITQVIPNPSGLTKRVLFDNRAVLSSDGKTFEFTISDADDHEITIIAEDTANGAKTEIVIPLRVDREDLIGILLVRPSTVGTDPFEVTFDASTTILNDTTDEIVSFSWDFGDGTEPKINFSESIITHTYRYDTKNENGTFTPVVTIKTKKWRIAEISPETDVIVKRSLQQLVINIDSHPAQVAKVGDRVVFSIEFSGLPTEIRRDFGDGKTLSCKTRQECGTINNIYLAPGTYLVRSAVEYSNQPTIEGTITLKVNP